MLGKLGGGGLVKVMQEWAFRRPDEMNFMTGPGSTRVLASKSPIACRCRRKSSLRSAMKVPETQRENG